MEEVILVDEEDDEIGVEEKMRAHSTDSPKLHRAFSVFIFNPEGMMLIQKRADSKYHSPGLWTNACCSHPRPGETTEEAAHRRLKEEMGFDTFISEAFEFIYKAEFDNGLTEWEYDHVFIGTHDGDITPDPDEVGDHKWMDPEELRIDIDKNPDDYTPWFKLALKQVFENIQVV
jgi:isopentenyl-diphosphate delta-isomerase